MLMGFFTTRHFDLIESKDKNDGFTKYDLRAKISIDYTIKKFSVFIPYIVIAVTIQVIFKLLFYNPQGMQSVLCEYFLELLLVYSSALDVESLWFISASVVIFPIFCFFVKLNRRIYVK